jgi:hypothetical protein
VRGFCLGLGILELLSRGNASYHELLGSIQEKVGTRLTGARLRERCFGLPHGIKRGRVIDHRDQRSGREVLAFVHLDAHHLAGNLRSDREIASWRRLQAPSE